MQTIATSQTQLAVDPVQHARRGLILYFALLIPLTALLEGTAIWTGQLNPWVIFLMFIPTLASVIARLTLHEGFGDVSFRLGGAGCRGCSWH